MGCFSPFGLNMDAFLLSVWRFIATWGTPFKILCNNSKNCVEGDRELREAFNGTWHLTCRTSWRGRFPAVSPGVLLMGRYESSLPQVIYDPTWGHSHVLADNFWSTFV